MTDSLVRVYDPAARSLTTIPARELSSDMLAAEVDGIDGVVYIHVDQLEAGPIRHQTLPPALIDRIREIAGAVEEVFPQTEEEWLDGFRRDSDPEAEVRFWERIAGKYRVLTSDVPDLERKTDIFHVLAQCAVNAPDVTALVADCPTLGPAGIQKVIEEWQRDSRS